MRRVEEKRRARGQRGSRGSRRPASVLSVMVFLTLCSACKDSKSTGAWRGGGPVPVLLISIDSLRADHLGAYGYDRPTSPNLDALAADGIVFERAYSTTTWTLPAHISLLTSLYPEIHGVTDGRMRLDTKAVLLSEILKEHGYRTLAVVSAPFLESKFGYDQGFDLYDDRTVSFRTHKDSHLGVTSPRLHDRIVEVLDTEARPNAPWFAFLHYWDVHYDYQPPAPFDTLFRKGADAKRTAADLTREHGMNLGGDPAVLDEFVALYDGEIAFVDHYLGKLFDYLRGRGLYDDALIIVVSDHGQEFLEHDLLFHRWNLYDSTLRVPLIIKLPGNRSSGSRVGVNVGLVDVAPTVLDVIGAAIPSHFNGRSLLPLIGGTGDDDTVYFAELAGKVRSVRRGRWKLIMTDGERDEKVELFDLASDPDEQTNLAAAEQPRAEELAAVHREWLALAERQGRRLDAVEFDYDEALEKALRSLGYVE